MTDRLLTLFEFARYICTSRRTARRIVERGEIPSFRIGASLRVRLSDVERFIEHRRIDRGGEASGLKVLVAKAVQRARERRVS